MFWVEDPTMCLVCAQRHRWVFQTCSYLVMKFFYDGIYSTVTLMVAQYRSGMVDKSICIVASMLKELV